MTSEEAEQMLRTLATVADRQRRQWEQVQAEIDELLLPDDHEQQQLRDDMDRFLAS